LVSALGTPIATFRDPALFTNTYHFSQRIDPTQRCTARFIAPGFEIIVRPRTTGLVVVVRLCAAMDWLQVS